MNFHTTALTIDDFELSKDTSVTLLKGPVAVSVTVADKMAAATLNLRHEEIRMLGLELLRMGGAKHIEYKIEGEPES